MFGAFSPVSIPVMLQKLPEAGQYRVTTWVRGDVKFTQVVLTTTEAVTAAQYQFDMCLDSYFYGTDLSATEAFWMALGPEVSLHATDHTQKHGYLHGIGTYIEAD